MGVKVIKSCIIYGYFQRQKTFFLKPKFLSIISKVYHTRQQIDITLKFIKIVMIIVFKLKFFKTDLYLKPFFLKYNL